MAGGVEVEIVGLAAVLDKLKPSLYAVPLRRFWERASITVQSNARKRPRMPVDTGRLTNSIAYEIDGASPPQYAKVGTDVFYAPFQEFGTSRGVPARMFLQGGFEDSSGSINTFVGVLGDEIAQNWGK
jgi:phage gpG-like protein